MRDPDSVDGRPGERLTAAALPVSLRISAGRSWMPCRSATRTAVIVGVLLAKSNTAQAVGWAPFGGRHVPWSVHDSGVFGAFILAAAPLLTIYLRLCHSRGVVPLGRSRIKRVERPALFRLLLWSYSVAVGGLVVFGLLALIQ